ncbi:MAG: hypothetical protein IJD60_05005 [Clostridia bacterium]|nr:hypothetical protein [Clostridia bacterium]
MKIIVMYVLLVFLVVIIHAVIMGVLCKQLAAKKGYNGYFWIGFLLGMLGLMYVAFLPDLKMRKYLHMCSMKMQIMEERLNDVENMLNG